MEALKELRGKTAERFIQIYIFIQIHIYIGVENSPKMMRMVLNMAQVCYVSFKIWA